MSEENKKCDTCDKEPCVDGISLIQIPNNLLEDIWNGAALVFNHPDNKDSLVVMSQTMFDELMFKVVQGHGPSKKVIIH